MRGKNPRLFQLFNPNRDISRHVYFLQISWLYQALTTCNSYLHKFYLVLQAHPHKTLNSSGHDRGLWLQH